MIVVRNSPNNTGVVIIGDQLDYERLYEALHEMVGDEDEHIAFQSARLRVLGICYDLRHALMGDREIEFVPNGMDKDTMKRMSVMAPDKNVYLRTHALWPEILFVTMALNDFARLYAAKKSSKKYDMFLSKELIWDHSLAMIRGFQAAIAQCIKDTVSPSTYSRVKNLMMKDYAWFDGYTWQYLDILNCRFIEMDKDKRLKNIPIMAKRLAERGDEYLRLRTEVIAAAERYNTSSEGIAVSVDYPDVIEW